MRYLIHRFREPSSWIGIMLVLGAFGIHLNFEQQSAISFLGMSLFGAPDEMLKKLLSFGRSIKAEQSPEPPAVTIPPEQTDANKPLSTILDDDARL